MTQFHNASAAAPGWYPDPAGVPGLRWWDGRMWGPGLDPAMMRRRPELPPAVPVENPFIWAVAFLPLLSVASLLLWSPSLTYSVLPGENVKVPDPYSMMTPGYFLMSLISWGVTAGSVVLAFLDWQRLGRSGVVRPFHWAWSFLGAIIYVVGRSVIVHKVAQGRGLKPVWIATGTNALLYVVITLKMAEFMSAFFAAAPWATV
jgi:hypothetical protein